MRHSILITIAVLCHAAFASVRGAPQAPVNVLTQHNDAMRTGQNLGETILNPSNVNSDQFGKLFDQSVDGYTYAQPLLMSAVSITAGSNPGIHNVVFIATEHDSVYAFDADSNAGANAQPLWYVSFTNTAAGVSSVPYSDVNSNDLVPEIGITSTPVIDATTGTLYVLAKTKSFDPANPSDTSSWTYHQQLHALDIHTGSEKPNSPIEIQASVFGAGDGNDGHGNVPFDALTENNRAGLLLLKGVVYIGWASHGDNVPYHGWLLGYNATTLQQVGVFNTTPDGGLGGIWMSGAGLSADARGNIFCSTGNGTFDTDSNGVHIGNNYGDSVLRLATGIGGSLTLSDYFTPSDQNMLNQQDLDLGSGGILLVPDQPGIHPHLAITCGKLDTLYVLNRDNLGGFHTGYDAVVEAIPHVIGGVHSMPAWFNGKVFYHSSFDVLKSFPIIQGQFYPDPALGPIYITFPGATPSVSADGQLNGIVWEIDSSGYNTGTAAVLRAYDAGNIAAELYDSTQAINNRDDPGDGVTSGFGVKFSVPTIANGKVYVGSQYALTVFGLLHNDSTLTVVTGSNGGGSVTPSFSGTTTRTVNQTYTITATPSPGNIFAGWRDPNTGIIVSRSPTLTFVMKENYSLEADFVADPFPANAGAYSGLSLIQTPSLLTGGPASFTVNQAGSFTGSIKFNARTYAIHGAFFADGTFSTTIARRGAIPISIQLNLDISNGTNEITGTISDGASTGNIAAARAVASGHSGKYTLVLDPPADPTLPQGYGYGTLTVNSVGNIRFTGVLGDGSTVSQGAVINGTNQWLFFAAAYGNKGGAIGTLIFQGTSTADIYGAVQWLKPATATPGIFTTVNVAGSAYSKTVSSLLNITGTASFAINGGGLNPPPAQKDFSIAADNAITLASGTTGLTMRFNLNTGLIMGTFTDAANLRHRYTGVVFQKVSTGNGLFKTGGKVGSIYISN